MDSLILAYILDRKGGGKPVKLKDIADKEEGLIWVHLFADHPDTQTWLAEKSGLDTFVIDAMIAEDTRPRILRHENGTLLILHGMNLNKDADIDDMVSIRIWIEKDKIVTVRRESTRVISEIEKKIAVNKGPKNSGDFIIMIITKLLKIMEPVIDNFEILVDKAEEQILLNPEDKLREDISEARVQAIVFKRHIAPQREVINNLGYSNCDWLDSDHKRYIQENYDIITRYVEDLNEIRERCQVIHDELENALSHKLNRNMYLLSVITSIFLPLSFVTSLLGANVGGIPWEDSEYGFLIVCLILLLFIFIQIIVLKKMKWF